MNSNRSKIGSNTSMKSSIHSPNKIISLYIKQLKYYSHFPMKFNLKEIESKNKELI